MLLLLCGHPVLAQQQDLQEPPLRHTEPLDTIVTDLERFIPERMESSGIPGLAIALVRDGQVAWAQGFGVTSRRLFRARNQCPMTGPYRIGFSPTTRQIPAASAQPRRMRKKEAVAKCPRR